MNQLKIVLGISLVLAFTSCSKDDDEFKTSLPVSCAAGESLLFSEANSLVLVEFEFAEFGEGWKLVTDRSNATGDGYMRWEGENKFSNPGTGVATYKIDITTTGTYRFTWRSAVTEGDNPTEGNDTWLRFADADDFFGEKGNGSIVYPGGTGKSPTPEGASKDGWFKIYRSGEPLDFKWQARTSDNDAHNIYVTFDSPGTYTMEISGRSTGHAVDKFLLFKEDVYTFNEATESTDFSAIGCVAN